MNRHSTIIFSLFALAFYLPFTFAANFETSLLDIQHEWANANYKLKDQEQKDTFLALIDKSVAFSEAHSDKAEALIWSGIVHSTYAGVKGGVGALKYAKKARKLFEAAIKIDPNALNGSAHTSLGTLYYKVPGFPIGFGSKKKAEKHLLKALEINPDGIDSNYFYGDFLINKKRYADAIPILEKALAAPDRPDRPIADAGRRDEIKNALSIARSKR